MKAIVCKEFSSVEKLSYEDVPDPVAEKGHVVVDIKACGVNFPDGLLVQGLYQMKPDFPFIPGIPPPLVTPKSSGKLFSSLPTTAKS